MQSSSSGFRRFPNDSQPHVYRRHPSAPPSSNGTDFDSAQDEDADTNYYEAQLLEKGQDDYFA
eukprot:4959990-Heterocapsa_arctica.AAC.1